MDDYKSKPIISKRNTPAVNDDDSNLDSEWENKLDTEIELDDELDTQLPTQTVKLHRIDDAWAARGLHKSIEAEFRTDMAQEFTDEEYWD